MHVRYGRAISYTRNALLIDKQLPLLRQNSFLCSDVVLFEQQNTQKKRGGKATDLRGRTARGVDRPRALVGRISLNEREIRCTVAPTSERTKGVRKTRA